MECQSSKKDTPLIVDLDGALIPSGLLWENLFTLLKSNIVYIFFLPFWLIKGKTYLEWAVTQRIDIDAENLAYRTEFVDFLKQQHASGRQIILMTSSPRKIAETIAVHLGIFAEIYASEPLHTSFPKQKAELLIQKFGAQNFDYAGHSLRDLPVFEVARQVIIVAPDSKTERYQKQHALQLFTQPKASFSTYLKMIRLHQWMKNLLIFVPPVLAHQFFNADILLASFIAFFAFSFAASAIYIINDIVDLSSDRQHVKKCHRPLASGMISIPQGLSVSLALLISAAALCFLLPREFSAALGLYVLTTFAYSLFFKRKLLIDVLCLAGLYSLRILGGIAATGIEQSFWLMAFSMFFFLSLALVKRYVELANSTLTVKDTLAGRAYRPEDREIVGQSGIASAFTAALILALYINNDHILSMYEYPWILWPLVPIVLYLNVRIWILAHRGEMDEDPVVFLTTDWRSQLVIVAGIIFFFIAGVH